MDHTPTPFLSFMCFLIDIQSFGTEHWSLCIQNFTFWRWEFQSSLAVLGERDKISDLYVEVFGAIVCDLGKQYIVLFCRLGFGVCGH